MTAPRQIFPAALAATAFLAGTQGAVACQFRTGIVVDLAAAADRANLRANSKRVVYGEACEFKNGGLRDEISGGPVQDAGNGRIYQYLNQNIVGDTFALVSDCNTRETISIRSPWESDVKGQKPELTMSPCGSDYKEGYASGAIAKGWHYKYPTLIAKKGSGVSLSASSSLSDFATKAEKAELVVDRDLAGLKNDGFGKPYRRKDRIDPYCGCKIFYPDSAGAQ